MNITNALAAWGKTKLREHAKLETFCYSTGNESELIETLSRSLSERERYTAVYVDLNIRGAGRDAGLGLIGRLRSADARLRYVPFVAVTSFPDYDTERKAREQGAIRFFLKTKTDEAQDTFGAFVHRMIMEANETLEQCEDQFWADAASLTARALRERPWRLACQDVLEFIHQNLVADALFIRFDDGTGILRSITSQDRLGIGPEVLKIDDVPFIRVFLRDSGQLPYVIIPSLGRAQVGRRLKTESIEKLIGMRALLVRISLGRGSFGLMSIYRDANAHHLRRRDADGLMQIALRLATAIMADEETTRLRKRQTNLVGIIRSFEVAPDELAVYRHLQDVLLHEIAESAPGGEKELKSSVRFIKPASNEAVRALSPSGFQTSKRAREINLEDLASSSLARAVWAGEAEYSPDVLAPSEAGHHTVFDPAIRATLTIPIMADKLCLGVATLESKRSDAFSVETREFASLLCAAAAEALMRIRTHRFLHGMVALVEDLTVVGRNPAEDYVHKVVRLLFEYTHCSEILVLLPPTDGGDIWNFDKIFLPDGTFLDGERTRVARRYAEQKWDDSYHRRVLTTIGQAAWDHDPDILTVHDEDFALRKPGEKTRTQAVIIVRKDFNSPPDALISMLFKHRHAVCDGQMRLLDKLGSVLASLLAHGEQFQRVMGLANIHEQEARLGQIFGQFRHSLGGRLAKLRAFLEQAAAGDMSTPDLLRKSLPVLTELDEDIGRNRGLVKVPVAKLVDLGSVWSDVRSQLEEVARRHDGSIEPDQLAGETAVTDVVILGTIIFNLIDNALRHGGAGVKITSRIVHNFGTIDILVTDTGKGISAITASQLFSPGQTTSADGTGMGLYLSANRAKDLGGSLALASTGPAGTTFRLSLPEVTS